MQDSKQLTVTNVRTLKMNDDVLAVCISPNSKHLAVSLLDCTIKVIFHLIVEIFYADPYLLKILICEA